MAKTLEEKIEVMTAFKNGKKIEKVAYGIPVDWVDSENPEWDWKDFDYRVKKQPKYRPYKDTTEMLEDFCIKYGVKRTGFGEPFIWIKSKSESYSKLLIICFNSYNVVTTNFTVGMNGLFENYTYLDGSLIGIME